MSKVSAHIEITGQHAAIDRLQSAGRRARRPDRALRSGGTLQDLRASERRQFSSGRGWPRDTPEWVREKRRRGLDPRTMRASGKLERALTSGHGMTFRVTGGTLEWGLPAGGRLGYARKLAQGTSSVQPHTLVVIDRTAQDRIAVRIERYITDDLIQ